MWQHPATVANLELLRARGALFVGPDRGELACGWIGEGRMMDPPIIVAAVRSLLQRDRSWVGRRVLVSAGPTRAYLDPVRFLSNASTGAMGFALAEAAAARGAEVVLVAGPVAEPTPSGVRRIDIETGAELLRACEQEFEAAPIDLLAMVAAVADLVPVEPAREKVAKEDVLARLSTMQWQAETDILATLSAKYGSQTRMLGFGAQTTDAESPEQVEQVLVREGAAKLARKGCHALFVNRVGVAGLGFASATNAGQLLFAGRQQGEVRVVDSGPARLKRELAAWMLDELARAWFDAERGPEFGAEQPHAGTELGPEPAQG
jgi:phosphopantothenoylcysteine decarboxylase/phosphopantothenate--cysteine ligase